MFFLDKPRTPAHFQQYHQALSNANIVKLLDQVTKLETQTAMVGGGQVNPTIRRSKILFIPTEGDMNWIYQATASYLREMNQRHFGFDLTAIESIQYTEYHGSEQGNYNDHVDWRCNPHIIRKLSMSIQLSDDNEYVGGNLEIKASSKPFIASRIKGDACVFPSFLLHGVTPVTSGIRRSLVVWALGPEFR